MSREMARVAWHIHDIRRQQEETAGGRRRALWRMREPDRKCRSEPGSGWALTFGLLKIYASVDGNDFAYDFRPVVLPKDRFSLPSAMPHMALSRLDASTIQANSIPRRTSIPPVRRRGRRCQLTWRIFPRCRANRGDSPSFPSRGKRNSAKQSSLTGMRRCGRALSKRCSREKRVIRRSSAPH
jgi:hypothetical protein